MYALGASTEHSCGSTRPAILSHSSPAVANGVVYVGSYDNNVYALNASTGALLWQYTTGQEVWSFFHRWWPTVWCMFARVAWVSISTLSSCRESEPGV